VSVIGYARVSTPDQDPAAQVEALKAAGCETVFAETFSGKTALGRDQLAHCLASLKAGDVLMVTKLDRLARSMNDLTRIVSDLVARNVGFRCLHQGAVDTTTLTGRLMLNILGAFAEFERELIEERRTEGIRRAKLAGKYVRPVDEDSAREAKRLRREGMGASAIARRLSERRGRPVAVRTVYRWTTGMWREG
jgi:DNA invertase Pin-like site-specific DNA recombinase